MKWLNFFIDRPITATVINLMMVVVGLLSIRSLLVDEYPRIIVPKLRIETNYRNASPETVEKEITNPLEEALALVEGLDRISSTSRAEHSKINLQFVSSVSMDRAVNQVSEQIARVSGQLPIDADKPQIMRGGNSGDAIFYLTVRSPSLSGAALTHFAKTHIKSHFQGIDGLAEVQVWGTSYAMQIELDPLAMHSQRVSLPQIVSVLKKNELLLQAGRTRVNEPININIVAKNAEDYRSMIVANNHSAAVYLGDIAQVNLVEDSRDDKIRVNGHNAVFLAITKASDGNILAVTDAVRALVPKVNQEIHGIAEISIETDKSLFVRESLKTIYKTIAEACILVLLIIFLFLRHLRATLIPLVTIPISLIATFFALQIFGLSINTITLLAMVLAVGLVVDDAIVVLENIFRYREQGLDAKSAARKGAQEIGFAIIAMTCTLMSVFVPLIFVSDITGALLREFAVTLAAAVLFSGIVALTLTPLMSAYILKNTSQETKLGLKVEHGIRWLENSYEYLLSKLFSWRKLVYGSLIILVAGGLYLYQKLPANLVPKEDRGIIGAWVPTIPGYDLDRMEAYVAQVEDLFINLAEVERTFSFASTHGTSIVSLLKPWKERKTHAETIIAGIREKATLLPSLTAHIWSWDLGLDALQDDSHDNASLAIALKSATSYQELNLIAQTLVNQIIADNKLTDARSDLNLNELSFAIDINRESLDALGIEEKSLSMALQSFGDRMRPSEFKLDGQRYSVYLQANLASEDLSNIYVSAKTGEQVPLSTVAQVRNEVSAPELRHLNQMRTATVLANMPQGMSLSQAQQYLDQLVLKHVPDGIAVSYQGALAAHKKSSQTFLLLFGAGLIFIFAVLAIQFEAIIDPLIILFTVPLACVGGAFLLWALGLGTNLYTQIGMLTLVGLITKHGILLTEFVAQNRLAGAELKKSVFEAARLRFRPIIMTTAATVLGALPLVIGSGAGSEARAAIGTVIVGGMIFGTALTLFVLPLAIYSVHTFSDRLRTNQA